VNFTQEQRDQLNRLIDHRDQITDALFHIERILKHYFPEEFEVAYQHWIPQIVTALYEDKKWLPRGEFTMQQTISRLLDKAQNSESKGVSRYI
jgi:soluble cytochrome b562